MTGADSICLSQEFTRNGYIRSHWSIVAQRQSRSLVTLTPHFVAMPRTFPSVLGRYARQHSRCTKLVALVDRLIG